MYQFSVVLAKRWGLRFLFLFSFQFAFCFSFFSSQDDRFIDLDFVIGWLIDQLID